MELNGTARLILGMISLGRRSGYEIKQLVSRATRHFWPVSSGQLYPELKRLEQRGLIRGEESSQGDRARVDYSLTPDGEDALRQWLVDQRELGFQMRDEAALKFYFAGVLDRNEVLELVRARRRRHERLVEETSAVAPEWDDSAPFRYLTWEYGIGLHTWIVEWCKRTEARLSERTPPQSRERGKRND